MRKFITWHNLKCEYGNASWSVIDGIVFVRTCDGQKAGPFAGGYCADSNYELAGRQSDERSLNPKFRTGTYITIVRILFGKERRGPKGISLISVKRHMLSRNRE
jgi:hypothetical protein